ncbi:gluzincin family metallopeptidase [Pelolinea submarina]|uniref:Uncharacterized protein n=1 Tax=Pelolinea submarina TaxID=913107 RepID=A0A347ZUF4_9CHLR|nr:hypothetical protein [Pelolinea submarina]REG10479.1 hypothetical protein DFR64_0337 [Pelolinea submarina]BBB48935.1 hypothetical protein Pelsub_P2166 [Pelolinea submarina]
MMKSKWNVTDYINLYQANHLLSKDNKAALGMVIPVKVYIQDPYASGTLEKQVLSEIQVAREPELMNGPTSSRIAVVDYDADLNVLAPAVIWNGKEGCFEISKQSGNVRLAEKHKDLWQFHQVNVWAIVQSILSMFETSFVLGRSAPWGFEGNRLIIVPHAGYMDNAFYDRHSKSIQLYYFGPENERIYTCLDHDIIAHETGHAILDGLRPYYLEDSSLQTTAFHEFIADITAVFSALRNNNLRQIMAEQTQGNIAKESVVANLAEGFSRYSTGKEYIRSALAKDTVDSVKDKFCPYEWSKVLTGAMWEILSRIVAKRKQILIKEGRGDSVYQLLWWAVMRFQRIIFQPLDFLPPADVQFSDYANAVLQADQVIYPDDKYQFREIMRDVFKQRGVYCEECCEDVESLNFYPYDIRRIMLSRTDAYHFINQNRRQLCIPANQDISVSELYQTDKTLPNGSKHPREIILQYTWREDVLLKGKQFGHLNGESASLLCGGTIVFDDRGNVLSWMRKPGCGKQETSRKRLRSHCKQEVEAGQKRKDDLLNYIKNRLDRGYFGFIDDDRFEIGKTIKPVCTSTRSDGTIRMEVRPNLRHWDDA